MKKTSRMLMGMLTAIVLLASCGGNNNGKREAQSLSGAGATFPLPFYNAVFEQFATVNGDEVAYGGIGSGGYIGCKHQFVTPGQSAARHVHTQRNPHLLSFLAKSRLAILCLCRQHSRQAGCKGQGKYLFLHHGFSSLSFI